MRDGATADARDGAEARARLDRIAALLAALGMLGGLIISRIGQPRVPNAGINTFFEQYRRHEPIFLALMAVFAIATAVLARRAPVDGGAGGLSRGAEVRSARWLVIGAVLVLAVTGAGTWGIMHALPFSMDEYVAAFQSHIFAAGRVAVSLPEEWRQFGRALNPVFVVYDGPTHTWLSSYWPLYGALRSLFLRVGADRLLNPALAALSVPLVYACARRLWPDDKVRAWTAVGFLVLSSQFLFMSMTGYSMPAHLAANLLWIYAFSRGDRAGWLSAPIVGVVALGLHNPVPHALFAAPFLLQLVLMRRWAWTAYFAVVYLAGIAAWLAWAQFVTTISVGGGLLDMFATPGLTMLGVQELSLTLILSWQTPLLAVLLIWVALARGSLTTTEQCLALGIVLSFGFFLFYPLTQGHGWGYRYTYPVLGNMALLGASGMARMGAALGRRTTQRLLLASTLVTVFVQLPLRAWQIERYVRPFARAHDYVAHIDADVVIVDPTTSWYGIDLIRNDPLLRNRPKVLSAYYLRPADKRALAARFGDRVHMLQASELAPLGVVTFPSRFRQAVWPPVELGPRAKVDSATSRF